MNSFSSAPVVTPGFARQRAPRLGVLLVLIALTVLALGLRTWRLDALPPGLWSDEASDGLDVRDLLHGQFRVFFPRAMGREPLYIYLATPFVAAWDGQAWAERLPAALLGTLMVPLMYLLGRATWRKRPYLGAWAGLVGAGFWAANFWPQSINRLGFHVNTFPFVLLLAVVTWLSWTARPSRRRAVLCGILGGLCLSTYLASRITPLLWALLYVGLDRQQRRQLRPTLPWAIGGYVAAVAPLAVHFLLRPQDLLSRVSVFQIVQDASSGAGQLGWLLDSFRLVVGVFLGWAGDPASRHNIPNRPPFAWWLAAFFAVGLLLALWRLFKRDQAAWTLLAWWGLLNFPAVLSGETNPHSVRLLAALPPALLLAAWPVAELASYLRRKKTVFRWGLAVVLGTLLLSETVRTAQAYFVSWAGLPELYDAFQVELWDLGHRLAQEPAVPVLMPLSIDDRAALDYGFRAVNFQRVQVADVEVDVEQQLADRLGAAGGRLVRLPVWRNPPRSDADARNALPFYLQREGRLQGQEALRCLDLYTYTLGTQLQFDAAGQQVTIDRPFSSDLVLVDARLGAAYPNADRSSTSVEAGTSVWAVLTWRVKGPVSRLRAAVDLLDAGRHRLDGSDQWLWPEQAPFGAGDPAGQIIRTYHLVPVPATQPSGPAVLSVRVYSADNLEPVVPPGDSVHGSLPLDGITVTRGLTSGEPPQIQRPLVIGLPAGFSLLGMDAWPDAVAPGQTLPLRFFWRIDRPLTADVPVGVSLDHAQTDTTVVIPHDTPVGQYLHTYADLRLAPELATGDHELGLSLPGASSAVRLGALNVTGRPRQFAPDSSLRPLAGNFGSNVALAGTHAPGELIARSGQPITLTLTWHVTRTPDEELVRFVHLLGPDGHPVAQEDARPCHGECPALSWVEGEFLTDHVQLVIQAAVPAGTYQLGVGWYSVSTLKRLPVTDGAGASVPNDLLVLPIEVRVGS